MGLLGWVRCKDKYGLSWQVVPIEYFDLINSDDPAVREQAMTNTLNGPKKLGTGWKLATLFSPMFLDGKFSTVLQLTTTVLTSLWNSGPTMLV